MGRRTVTELLHLAAGLVMVLLFAWLASWAVPLAAGDIWVVAMVAVLAVGFMGIRPLRLAMAADRADADGAPAQDAEA